MLPASPGKRGQYKVVLVGDAGVGKTSLVKTLKYGCETWQDHMKYVPTAGSQVTNYSIPTGGQLYIVDTSGNHADFSQLVKQYLRHLDCIIFVFALDDRASLRGLERWVELFETESVNDPDQVKKFVVGTKLDTVSRLSEQIENDFLPLARKINAEFSTTSAKTATNLHELFKRVGDALAGQNPCLAVPPLSCHADGSCLDTTKDVLALSDILASPGAFLCYPDPVAIESGSAVITEITLDHRRLVMTGKDEELMWGADFGSRFQEPVLVAKTRQTMGLDLLATNSLKPSLHSCAVRSNSSGSTWQHQHLSGQCVKGITVKRQPTRTNFNDIKEVAFCSRRRDGLDRDQGLFYMLMLTTLDTLVECGVRQGERVQMTAENLRKTFKLDPLPLAGPPYERIRSFSTSITHSVVAGNTKVRTWGDLGQTPTPDPAQTSGLGALSIIHVACGIDFTLMLSSNWKVYSYGRGEFGQLGHGDEEDKAIPTLVKGLPNTLAISAGNHHAAAVGGGNLYGWGLQCNDETLTKFETKPKQYRKDYTTVTSVSCGAHHTLCIANGYYPGIVYSCGRGTRGQLGHRNAINVTELTHVASLYKSSRYIQMVSAGRNHSAFLTSKGEVFTCGCNRFGQLGYLTEDDYGATPQKVDLGRNDDNEEIRAKQVCCSEDCTMVLTKADDVLLWGKSFYGCTVDNPVPTDVKADRIIGVTTCSVLSGSGPTDLVFALTDAPQELILCAANRSSVDTLMLGVTIPCSVAGLASMASAGSILLASDGNGKVFFADCHAWCQDILSLEDAALPSDLPRALGSTVCRLSGKKSLAPSLTWEECALPDGVRRVEATLNTVFYVTNAGDLYGWTPVSGKPIGRHAELDDVIVVDVACGMQHAAVLLDEGVVLTSGKGFAGQLGHGTFESVWKFNPVPLTKSVEIMSISCGVASTAVLSSRGKVFFWGQLDLPESEKNEAKMRSLQSEIARHEVSYALLTTATAYIEDPNAALRVELENKDQQQIAVLGRSFEFRISQRRVETDSGWDPETVVRVEACSIADTALTHVKGKVKYNEANNTEHKASIVFPKEGAFRVSVTTESRHAIGSPFKLRVEKGVCPSRCKATLIGQNMRTLRSVGDTLQQQEATESFASAGLHVEFWGIPGPNTDNATHHAATLTSLTNGGLYVYVWDSLNGRLPEVHITYWLQILAVKVPQSEVLILALNASAALAKRLDLKPFQDVNPNLKKAVLVGSAYQLHPTILVKEMRSALEEKVLFGQEVVWSRAEELASRVAHERDARLETLSRMRLKSLAMACGIHSGYCFMLATRFVEEVGLGLITGQEEAFLVLQETWLTRNLQKVSTACHHGVLDGGALAGPMKSIVELLVSKQLAVSSEDQTCIHVVYSSQPIHEKVWKPVDSTAFTTSRHVVLKAPPYTLHTLFHELVFKAVKTYPSVSIGRNTLVIHDAVYECRVDCGPCFVNRQMSEVRVMVRSKSPDSCGSVADAILSTLFDFDDLSQPFVGVKISCSKCLLQYIDQASISTVDLEGGSELKCQKCMKDVPIKDLKQGYQESRPIQNFEWTTVTETDATPESIVQPLLSPVVRYLDERLQHEKAILAEVQRGFSDMIKMFEENTECTVPRTVFLRPEVEKFQSLPDKLRGYMGPNKKWRVFLLCEGAGTGQGLHFLDVNDHRGYELSSANEFVLKHAGLLRMVLQVLLNTVAPNAALFVASLEAAGLMSLFPSEETQERILGAVGLNVETVKRDWKKYLNKMDEVLKSVEENAQSSSDPKDLAREQGTAHRYKLHSADYKHLQKLLSALGKKDNFGGMVREFRKGRGYLWVCKQHSKQESVDSPTPAEAIEQPKLCVDVTLSHF